MKSVMLIICLVVLFVSSVYATDYTWTSAISGSWNDSSKWTPIGVPNGIEDRAYLSDGMYSVTINIPLVLSRLVAGESNIFTAMHDVYINEMFLGEGHTTTFLQFAGNLYTYSIVGGTININQGVLQFHHTSRSYLNLGDNVTLQNAENYVGDLTGDGTVNLLDFSLLAANWLCDPSGCGSVELLSLPDNTMIVNQVENTQVDFEENIESEGIIPVWTENELRDAIEWLLGIYREEFGEYE